MFVLLIIAFLSCEITHSSTFQNSLNFLIDYCKFSHPYAVYLIVDQESMGFSKRRGHLDLITRLSKNGVPTQIVGHSKESLQMIWDSKAIKAEPLMVFGIKNSKDLSDFHVITKAYWHHLARWLLIFGSSMEEICVNFHEHLILVHKEMSITAKCSDDHEFANYYTSFVKTEITRYARHNGTFRELIAEKTILFKIINSTYPYMSRVQLTPDLYNENRRIYDFLGNMISGIGYALNIPNIYVSNFTREAGYQDKNGQWHGMIGLLVEQKADLAEEYFTIRPETLKVVDFTVPILESESRIYFRVDKRILLRWDTYSKVFQNKLWITLAVALALSGIVFTGIRICIRKKISFFWLLTDSMIDAYGMFCDRGSCEWPIRRPEKIMHLSILVFGLLVCVTYSGSILSSLLEMPEIEKPYETFEDFLNMSSNKVIVIKDSIEEQLVYNKLLPESRLIPFLDKDMPLNFSHGFERICQDDVAFFTTAILITSHEKQIDCLYQSVVVNNDDRLAMAVRKASPFRRLINIGILKLKEMGFVVHLMREQIIKPLEAAKKTKLKEIIQFSDVAENIRVLFVGIGLSLSILTMEIVHHKLMTRKLQRSKRRP